MKKDYTIGLDIGTSSVGWAVVKDNYELIKKRMPIQGNTELKSQKKNFWGVRLFEEGQTAQDTRLKRTNRRRLSRRKNRILYLQDIFTEEMNKIDSNFFHRLQESFLVEKDKNHEKHPIFGTIEEEVAYHKTYPTIYHLRKELADSTDKADLRCIYLALAHILKFRGHFLIEGKLDANNSSIKETFRTFLEEFNRAFLRDERIFEALDTQVNVEKKFNAKVSKSEKVERVLTLFPDEKQNGTLATFLKLIVGNQANFKNVFDLDEKTVLQFNKDSFEEDLESLLEQVGSDYTELFVAAKNVYDAIELSEILTTSDKNTKAKLSASMIQSYDEHQKDLKKFKRFIRDNIPDKYQEVFNNSNKDGYAGYIENPNKTTQENFYAYTKKLIDGIPGSDYFLNKIEQEGFLKKQRSFHNGAIPHQIHESELIAILKRQFEYYPFLYKNYEKILSIFNFRIPYYVGPLAKENSDFSWIVRKQDEKIRPWNIDKIVDEQKSAIKFIENMTSYDSYLPEEKVLPKHSMLYEKYMVFNELTKVTYSNEQEKKQSFSSKEKINIFNQFFKKKRKVKKEDIKNYVIKEMNFECTAIEGIDAMFNANFGTYHDLLSKGVDRAFLDNPQNENIIEDIIMTLTVFEDKKMISTQLAKYEDIFDQKVLKKLARRHYTGWGRLSKKMINGIRDNQTNKTILDYLIDDDGIRTNRNFMQLINDDDLSFKRKISEAQQINVSNGLLDSVNELTGSPAIKKGILQSLKIIDEIISIMGYLPKNIVIEMARENQTTREGIKKSQARYKKLEEAMGELGSSILKDQKIENSQLQRDRLYLYYLQNGKDMYTGEDLDISRLSYYDIDHIIPQSFIVDNSIDNKVLVSMDANRAKGDDVPSKKVVHSRLTLWNALKKAGLISTKKYDRLTKSLKDGLTENDKAGFIQRQIVETRQITKNVAAILEQRYNKQTVDEDKVSIITLKAALTSQFRKQFELYKVREINDHHHAHDAYLNSVVAIALLKFYPQLTAEFVYGEYMHNRFTTNKATAKKEFYTNIMRKFYDGQTHYLEDGEIFWDNQSIAKVKKVMSYHQVNVSKKTEVQTGKFSKETILPKGNSTKLIPRKTKEVYWSPDKYGGFGSPVVAYSIIFSYVKGKKAQRKKDILGIKILEKKAFEADEIQFLVSKGFKDPIILVKLPKYTLCEFETGRRRLVASNKELHKGNQMILPTYLVTFLYHCQHISDDLSGASRNYVMEHRNNFDILLNEIYKFNEQFTLAQQKIKKVTNLYEKNKEGNIEETAASFVHLLQLNKFGAPTSFKFFGENIDRTRYNSTKEILNSTFIYQSITGLFETRVKLED